MGQFETLFAKYDRLVIFDTETTGLDFQRNEIIQFSALALEQREGQAVTVQEYDHLITLTPGRVVPEEIVQLTGITTEMIQAQGIPKTQLCQDVAALIAGRTLLLAYNAQFDFTFLYYLLREYGDPCCLQGKGKLDLLTVYRDRKPFPHKLKNAIEVYGLSDKVVNSHRAIDDVYATVEVMRAMDQEKADLAQYINLFGYLEKYGVDGKPIRSVAYGPQGFEPREPLYERVRQKV